MTQEEKQLLLKDICARLPYGVIVKENDGVNENDNKLLDIDMFDGCINYDYTIDDIKPYLRPMDSMTEEEVFELIRISDSILRIGERKSICILSLEQMDWPNAHHIDYRGLIDKGLALEAPEDMYKTEQSMEDLSYLGCKWHPQAYDADVCENCVYDKECYARFLHSMNLFKENVPLNTFGKMAKTE